MENQKVYLSEEFKDYKKVLSKYIEGLYVLDRLDNPDKYTITLVTNTYEKLGRKGFPRNPTITTSQIIDARQYACYITSIGFFHDRVVSTYTNVGYLPTRLTCVNPNREIKIERIFHISRVDN